MEQEGCSLFLATRAEFWFTVSQHFVFLISSQAWLTSVMRLPGCHVGHLEAAAFVLPQSRFTLARELS